MYFSLVTLVNAVGPFHAAGHSVHFLFTAIRTISPIDIQGSLFSARCHAVQEVLSQRAVAFTQVFSSAFIYMCDTLECKFGTEVNCGQPALTSSLTSHYTLLEQRHHLRTTALTVKTIIKGTDPLWYCVLSRGPLERNCRP